MKSAGLIVAALLTGAMGWIGTACVAHLYQDHLLVDGIRINLQQQQQQRPPAPKTDP